MNKIQVNTGNLLFYLKVLIQKRTSQSSPAGWNQDRNPKNRSTASLEYYKICNEVSGKSW